MGNISCCVTRKDEAIVTHIESIFEEFLKRCCVCGPEHHVAINEIASAFAMFIRTENDADNSLHIAFEYIPYLCRTRFTLTPRYVHRDFRGNTEFVVGVTVHRFVPEAVTGSESELVTELVSDSESELVTQSESESEQSLVSSD